VSGSQLTTIESVYTGGFIDSRFQGKGTYKFKNGDEYKGDFKAGRFAGSGSLSTTESTCSGTFIEGELTGLGACLYKNGDKYDGKFKKSDRDGRGTYIKKDGSKIEGIWKAGQIT
jgi:hypothetical protein